MNEYEFLNWLSKTNYAWMQMQTTYWMKAWIAMFFMGSSIGMTPLQSHHEDTFLQVNAILLRKAILLTALVLLLSPLLQLYLYDVTASAPFGSSAPMFVEWFRALFVNDWYWLVTAFGVGTILRIIYFRYIEHSISTALHKLRRAQVNESLSDIRDERAAFIAKDFLPSIYYKEGEVFIGLDIDDKPIYVSYKVWLEVNFQVIGPTRFGKGVIIGVLADQLVRRGDAFIYIDPKKDTFAPALMYQAAKATGRPFYYVCLHDDGPGQWAPFQGGTERDALARVEIAFQLEYTGDPGTDFYKSQEGADLLKAFKQSRGIDTLHTKLQNSEAARIKAELTKWKSIKALCPKPQSGFSLEKALLENAVVYIQGSLTDSVVKTATKIFIVEIIQESMRLRKQRTAHLTAVIDEVRFLVSKQLADALATVVGFDVNIVTAYQSIKDLEAPDDKSLNGQSILQSINVNSQLKAVYGGADFDTAEWIANLSGTLNKTITKLEKTEIRKSGGEVWDDGRMVGTQEENYIPTNRVLALPPRVCVFIQPGKNATTCFTSFVPVEDQNALPHFIDQLDKKLSPPKSKDQQATPASQPQLTPSTKSFIDDHSTKDATVSDPKPGAGTIKNPTKDPKPNDSKQKNNEPASTKQNVANKPQEKSNVVPLKSTSNNATQPQKEPTQSPANPKLKGHPPSVSDPKNSAETKPETILKPSISANDPTSELTSDFTISSTVSDPKNSSEAMPETAPEHSISHKDLGSELASDLGTSAAVSDPKNASEAKPEIALKSSNSTADIPSQLASDFGLSETISDPKNSSEAMPETALEHSISANDTSSELTSYFGLSDTVSDPKDSTTNLDDETKRELNKAYKKNRKERQKHQKRESKATALEQTVDTPREPTPKQSERDELKSDEEMLKSLDEDDEP